jgi:hypothetical protein
MLDEANAWRDRIGTEIDASLELLRTEETEVRTNLEEAQRQFNALSAVRHEEEERLVRLEQELVRRRRSAVRQALILDRTLLEDRASALQDAQARDDASASRGLDAPEVAAALTAWVEAREIAAGLAPARPVAALGREARARLEPFLQAADAPPPVLNTAAAGVGVLVSADPTTGPPEALLLVLPVPWSVYAESAVRTEDLCTMLTYRLVSAVLGLLLELEAPDAPVRYVDLHGCLAIQVWLGDHTINVDPKEHLLERIAAAVENAPELEAAGVEVYAVWLTPDLLAEGP